LNLGATALIYIIKFLYIIKRLITAFFVFVLYKPGRFILRLFFYQVVVRLYRRYISLMSRLGWSRRKTRLVNYLFSQKLVHIFVFILTVVLIFINLTARTRADVLNEMANKTILADLIKSEYSEYAADEELIVETFDKEAAVSSIERYYLDNLSSLKPQPGISMNGQEEEGGFEEIPTIQGGTSMIKPEIATTQISKRPRPGIITYTVQSGDTISTIAEEFDISVSTILWENNLTAYSIIRPGDELVILPTTGLTYKVAKGDTLANIAMKYKVDETVILEANKLASAAKLQIGQKLLVPGGRKAYYATAEPKAYTGFSALRDFVQAPSAKPVAGNKMNWPTLGYQITQYFSWRHHAVDIANKIGTPVFAADAGGVEYVGWGQGYGNQIVIDHGGGKKTRYAHLSKAYVKVGERVSKGQTIAAMGSTGWSTGPHLHFEVIIDNSKYNPLNYIR
jgi:murein DD-endopeptidase MepM/ murein hydrolase activator NlpD